MDKRKKASILIGLFIFGIIIGVSQSKEKILADRQAKEDQKIAAQQRLEAEKQAEQDKKNAKEEKKKAKEEAKNKPESAPEGVPNISERPADACSVQPSDKFWVPKAPIDKFELMYGDTYVITKDSEGAYWVPRDGAIIIERNWYCPQSQQQSIYISGEDKKFQYFYVLEGETIHVQSLLFDTTSYSVTFSGSERVYSQRTLVTDYTLPGRRYE